VTDEETTKIINRLKSIEGHVKGVTTMVENEACCVDIVNQINAVQAALHKVSALMLDRHLHTCVITALRSDDSVERAQMIDQIMGVFNAREKLG
jgi:DNA-binding FrmR family transcriptional regulator